LKMEFSTEVQNYDEEILHDEIEGLQIFHKVSIGAGNYPLAGKDDHATFLLVLKGTGLLLTNYGEQTLEEESFVLLPKGTQSVSLILTEEQQIHYLVFSKKYSTTDKEILSTQNYKFDELYYTRFQDCTPYTEKIKSPNTISRTILPGGIIPRVALGTVEANGPDQVGAHSHPMLEQIFVGLSDNDIIVYADDASAEMKAYSILHIPLGSTHWVKVKDNCKMNYMWMDFFLTKEGESWLNTHNPVKE
ncbi:cupin domain-containing protein, partial [Saprospiraceae bacterium]|nr:cupin domain-containing protein [Saprospiraceae bacterium]